MKHVSPNFGAASFSCPHCGALAQQQWFAFAAKQRAQWDEHQLENEWYESFDDVPSMPGIFANNGARALDVTGWMYAAEVFASKCFSCQRLAIWVSRSIAWPSVSKSHHASPDLPEEVRADFEEADAIHAQSPRGAAALLRLAIQKLCEEIEPGAKDNLNAAIGRMVSKGLSLRIQQALDIVRVTGNNAVHPGVMDLKDDAKAASNLFGLVNLIADAMITQPKKVQEMYDALPEGAKAGVTKRDSQSAPKS